MIIRNQAMLAVGCAIAAAPVAVSAQTGWVPGAEITGQAVQVETNGITNTVYFDPGGTARIVTPSGTSLPASWTASAGQLCLYSGGGQECWPYQSPFQAGQQISLTSSCSATSRWLASATNPIQQQVAPEARPGERG